MDNLQVKPQTVLSQAILGKIPEFHKRNLLRSLIERIILSKKKQEKYAKNYLLKIFMQIDYKYISSLAVNMCYISTEC